MTTSVPAQSLPYLQINNLRASNDATTPNTKLDFTIGQMRCGTAASPSIADITFTSAIVVNFGVNGANGLDTGTIGASSWYYIHAIGSTENLQQPALIASLSATAPLLPAGYDVFGVVAVWPTDSSSHLITGYVAGNRGLRQHYYDTMIRVVTSGTATTLTAVDLSAAVPPIDNTPVLFEVAYTPATANDKVSLAPAGSTATVLPSISSVVAAKVQTGQLKVLSKLASGVAKVQYINSAASGNTDAWVSGFEYFV